jgi:hypothetical protein
MTWAGPKTKNANIVLRPLRLKGACHVLLLLFAVGVDEGNDVVDVDVDVDAPLLQCYVHGFCTQHAAIIKMKLRLSLHVLA